MARPMARRVANIGRRQADYCCLEGCLLAAHEDGHSLHWDHHLDFATHAEVPTPQGHPSGRTALVISLLECAHLSESEIRTQGPPRQGQEDFGLPDCLVPRRPVAAADLLRGAATRAQGSACRSR
jgi:hypothetical protein